MTEIAERINCPNCGAPLPLRAGEVIITCEYCGASHNMAVGTQFFLKHSIIPNVYEPAQAIDIARRWMHSGFLKPEDLAKRAKIVENELRFLPFFVMRVVASSKYNGVFTRTGQNIPKSGELRKEYYWKILGRRASGFPVKEYEIPLSGKVEFDLSRVSKGAKFLNSELDETEARALMQQEIEEHHKYLLSAELDITQDISTNVDIKDTEFVHGPVWFIKYEYKGNIYRLLLDGATGATIRGDIPSKEAPSVGGFLSDVKRSFFGK